MTKPQSSLATLRQVSIVSLVLAGTMLLGAIAVLAADVLLILGLAILFGVFLAKASDWIRRSCGIPYAWGLSIVTSTLVLAFGTTLAFVGSQVNKQVVLANEHLDKAEAGLIDAAEQYPLIKVTVQSTPYLRDLVERTDAGPPGEESERPATNAKLFLSDSASGPNVMKSMASRAMDLFGRVFTTTLGLVVNSLLIFFVGLFLASSPDSYRVGITRLFPVATRERISEVLEKIGDSLWRWLIGRFGSMLITGVGAGGLLFLCGVPLALTIGLVTAMLTFVPNIGGLLAVLIAVLFAIPQGATVIITVIVGYALLQLIESYLVTPLIQQSQVSLPPALLIAFQAILGVAFGLLGAAIASPLLAGLKVAVEELYVKDYLEADVNEDS